MSKAARAALAAAYRATTYRVHLADGDVDIRVDRPHPEIDRWLAVQAADCWAWITAVNPGSVRLSEHDNRRRLAALVGRLDQQGYVHVAGESIADAGDWPREAGVLVAGLDRESAIALAAAFGQNAILLGEGGKHARLAWLAGGSGS